MRQTLFSGRGAGNEKRTSRKAVIIAGLMALPACEGTMPQRAVERTSVMDKAEKAEKRKEVSTEDCEFVHPAENVLVAVSFWKGTCELSEGDYLHNITSYWESKERPEFFQYFINEIDVDGIGISIDMDTLSVKQVPNPTLWRVEYGESKLIGTTCLPNSRVESCKPEYKVEVWKSPNLGKAFVRFTFLDDSGKPMDYPR
jgi:hypothetical protein